MPEEYREIQPENPNQPGAGASEPKHGLDETDPLIPLTEPPADTPADQPADILPDPFADDDETDPLDFIPITDEDIARADLRDRQVARDPHDAPTVPLPDDEPEDPRKTLLGSGGLDPNPDFNPPRTTRYETQSTVPHIVPFQHTLVHVPGENRSNRVANPPPNYTQPAPGYGMPPTHGGSPYGLPQYGAPRPPVPAGQGVLPARKRRRTFLGCTPGCLMVFVGLFVTFCGGLTLIALVLSATLGAQLEERLQAQIAQVDTYDSFQSTFFYDRGGTLLYESFGEGRRINVNYEDFPDALIQATIATEDATFFTNPGFEVQATLRAFLQYVGLAEGSTGGSTITQQLVRNVLFAPEYRAERSVQRKVEEILLAFLLTQRRTKEEILTLYLNEIYYGNLAYGAEAAAQTFFNKSVRDLTLGEAALLAGLPQAPANLDPFNPDPTVQAAVEARWRTVLDRMVAVGYITDEQRSEALRQGYTIVPPEAPLRAPHFTVYARARFEELMGELGYTPEEVAGGGYRVYTTLDLRVNEMAERAAQQQIAGLAANNVTNAAVLVLQPVTGEIIAMVGSVDYNNEAIDGRVNVTTAPRQPGSTMKPFTYALAMEMGMTPGHIIWDTETEIGTYRPVNYDRTFHGPVRMRTALANSYNIPAVQTLRRVGVDNLLNFMSRLGVQSLGTDASRYGLSLTLGGGEITLLELTRAYSVFANGGAYVPTTAILCILDNNDNILYEYEGGCQRGQPTDRTVVREGYGTQVIDPRIAFIIADILGDNNARSAAMGFNSPLNTGNLFTSVKTGTTDDFRDNWTVGFTRNVAVGVWVGNSDGQPMVNSTGLTGAAPIWNSVITGIYNNQDLLATFAIEGSLLPDRLDVPQGMSQRQMCDLSTLREPALDCPGRIMEWFLDGPAGVPDGQGGLIYPPVTPPPPVQPPASGPWLIELEPDIYRVLVHPIPPDIASGIVFATAPGQPQPPPPLYCQVPVELAASAPAAREQVFIAPPPDPTDAVRAEHYARNAGLSFLPSIACSPELLNATGGSAIVTAFISSPAPGEVVTGPIPIIGTASFSPTQATYYKVELLGGPFASWATVGDIHYQPVVNGVLENLAALPSGAYSLQLVVVGLDGNYVQPPYRVDFVVP